MVSVRLVDYQQKLAQGYNRKVRPQEFVVGNLVLWKAIGSMKDHNAGKQRPEQKLIIWKIWKKDPYPDHGTFVI